MQQTWKVSECVTAFYEILTWNEIYVFWTCAEQCISITNFVTPFTQNVFTLFAEKPTYVFSSTDFMINLQDI